MNNNITKNITNSSQGTPPAAQLLTMHPSHKPSLMRRFRRQEHGSSMVEFAIILPILVSIIFGTLHMGLMMVALNAIDAAAREASRFGITGTVLSGLSRSASIVQVIQTAVHDYSGGILSPAKIIITEESFPNIAALEATPIGTLNSFGTGGEVVRYTIQYNWDTVFPIFGSSSIIPLKAEAVVVNENF